MNPQPTDVNMKAIWITTLGVCAACVCFAHQPGTAHVAAFTESKSHSTKGTCLLGNDCLGMSKVPAKTCRVTGKGAKAKDACAIDGMRLIGKFTV